MTVRPILAAADGSPLSLDAVRWAAEEAVRRGAALRLVHIWPRPVGICLEQLQAEGARVLARVQEEVAGQHPELEVDPLLLGASPVDGLVEAAADGALLVLGTRGLGGFTGLMMGSVSLAVAGRSPVPVVVVRPGQPDRDETSAARQGDVVVGVGGGDVADEVLEFAFSWAAQHAGRVVAVHGWDVPAVWAGPGAIVAPFDSGILQRAAEQHLADVLGAWREKYPQVPVVARTEVGGAAKAVVDASDDAGLVVIGRRMRRHAAGGHLGATAHAVLHHAHAPVAVVPHP